MANAAAKTPFNRNHDRAEGRGDNNSSKREKFQPKQCNKHVKLEDSSIAYVQILGTGMDTLDTLPSVLLFFDNFRVIFNAGEGLQRFCAEHKIKLSKIDYICLSRVCSETIGGLPGLLLTLAGIGEGLSVNLRGPSDLKLLVAAMKSFVPHASIREESFGSASCSVAEACAAPNIPEDPITICDNAAVKITAILLRPTSIEDSFAKAADKSVIYICELPEIKGKFYREKAEAHGLDPGPKYQKLRKGESVKSDRLDIMVHPSDVMDPSIPGPIVFLVDCPTEHHAEKLFMIQSLNSYYVKFSGDAPQQNKTVNCIIHLTPASIVNTAKYQIWMRKFGLTTQHIMAGYSMKNIGVPILKSSARITNRLSYLCPQFFPAPASLSLCHQNSVVASFADASEEHVERLCDSTCAENLLKFNLRPHAHLGLDKSNVPSLFAASQVVDDLLAEVPEIIEAAEHVGRFWCKPKVTEIAMSVNCNSKGSVEDQSLGFDCHPSCLDDIQRDEVEIVLLGTGSSQPSKYRNVSSIYINLFSKGSLLLDCGEGTLAQLRRRFGMEGTVDAVKNLRCIWISHIHADHHAGLVRILAMRRDLLKGMPHEPLLVVGPKQLATFLEKYNELEDLNMQFLDCRSTTTSAWDAFGCGDVSTECRTFSSDVVKTEHFNIDDNINNNNKRSRDSCRSGSGEILIYASLPVTQREAAQPVETERMDNGDGEDDAPEFKGRCSKRQKLCVPVVDGVDLSLLKRLKEVLGEAGLEQLTSFPVVHCPEAFGVILKARERLNSAGAMKPGWKIVYSGDTGPCMEVIQASHGATLLIHEATFEDGLAGEALARNHSTTREAIEVGESSGAYRVILTHFSQRYPKIPSFDDINSQKTCIAFDLMSINMADLPLLPLVLPYFKLLFKNDMPDQLEAS